MIRIAWILFASLVAHLLGSAIFFGIISGPPAILFAPLLALFGWFLIPLESLVIATQSAFQQNPRRRGLVVWLLTVPPAVIVMAAFGPKESGDAVRWAIAYAISTTASASASLAVLLLAHRHTSGDSCGQ